MQHPAYRGRFAPSPTGPLHFGSLVAAVGSFVDARARGGEWLLRMEDLDPPREVPGAADDILRTLEEFGLHWDGEVVYQSRRHEAYRAALDQLEQSGLVYPCGCSRKEIQSSARVTETGGVYPGTCRNGLAPGRKPRAVRIRVSEVGMRFIDRLRGGIEEWLPQQVGDFVVKRADGLFAYQLAVVVDDATHGITDIVRGADLLDSTCRQIYLQQCLQFSTPRYLHLPLAANRRGEKLSKQTHAAAVNPAHATTLLREALAFLNQELPDQPDAATPEELLNWAVAHWNEDVIPRQQAIRLP
jgi:glutamyl-Q tRNA(Asp) synthetase